MTLPMDDAGLPRPGRELDRWIAEHVLEWTDIVCCAAEDDFWGCPPQTGDGFVKAQLNVPHYSGTSAFFEVMEANQDWIWDFMETGSGVLEVGIMLPCTTVYTGEVHVRLDDYSDREHAYAHAVCCCAWKAMSDA